MSIGKLEPLYRYLRMINGEEPVSKFLGDIEILARLGYIENGSREGTAFARDNPKIKCEIDKELAALVPVSRAYHMMYQAIGKEMFLSLSGVVGNVSKTVLSLCITERDAVVVDYMEYRGLFDPSLVGQTLWNSISTVVVDDTGATKRGFIRAETTFMPNSDFDGCAIKCDFKLSRTKPFYISITGCLENKPTGVFGANAKEVYEQLESAWKV